MQGKLILKPNGDATWIVYCANCRRITKVYSIDRRSTAREALKSIGWNCIKQLWYCKRCNHDIQLEQARR